MAKILMKMRIVIATVIMLRIKVHILMLNMVDMAISPEFKLILVLITLLKGNIRMGVVGGTIMGWDMVCGVLYLNKIVDYHWPNRTKD